MRPASSQPFSCVECLYGLLRYEKLANVLLEETQEAQPRLDLLTELLAFKRLAPPPLNQGPEDALAWRAEELMDAADAFKAPRGPIDPAEVARYFGVARETEELSEAAKEEEKQMKQQRAALRLSLLAKAAALSESLANHALTFAETASAEGTDQESGDAVPPNLSKEVEVKNFMTAVSELKQWVESDSAFEEESDKDALALTLFRYELLRSKPGAALALLRSRLSKQPISTPGVKPLTLECMKLYFSMGLDFWATNAEESLFARFPVVKLPF